MKKTAVFVLLLSLLPLLSCGKKNRVSTDTLTIAIDPSTARTVTVGKRFSLTRSAGLRSPITLT